MRALLATLAVVFAAGTHASLRVVGDTVRGTHFAPHELVRVTFLGPAPRIQRRVRTTAKGAFTTSLPTAYDPCNESLTITARGATGDDARLKLPQRACPPSP